MALKNWSCNNFKVFWWYPYVLSWYHLVRALVCGTLNCLASFYTVHPRLNDRFCVSWELFLARAPPRFKPQTFRSQRIQRWQCYHWASSQHTHFCCRSKKHESFAFWCSNSLLWNLNQFWKRSPLRKIVVHVISMTLNHILALKFNVLQNFIHVIPQKFLTCCCNIQYY